MAYRKLSIALLSIPIIGLAVVLLTPLIWAVFYFGVYLGYGNYKVWGHQDFARNGIAQIEPASQMNRLFDDCRHYITYAGRDSESTWNSVAFFGERYKLTMQVPVAIESSTRGRIVGEPRFYLNEVSSVSISPTGQIGAGFSRGLNFGSADWKKVYDASGDFGAIGFEMNTTPVASFRKYSGASRASN